ncbi:MAG: magnesium chelatase domain-containing protein [Actinomycetota bacterium]
MDVRVWGEVQNRLVEVRATPGPAGAGLRIDGLPADRGRTTADRVRAALINAGIVAEVPAGVVWLEPAIRTGPTGELDLAVAMAVLASAGLVGGGLRWMLAAGRLRPDGEVWGVQKRLTLREVVEGLCQTPLVASEQMFEKDGS